MSEEIEIKPAPIKEWCEADGVHFQAPCPVSGCDSEIHITMANPEYVRLYQAGEHGIFRLLKRQISYEYWKHLGRVH